MLTETFKINYIYKKLLGKPNTLINEQILQEPNIIFGNIINTQQSIFTNKNLYRDNIPNTVSTTLINTTTDNNNNTIIGSLIGKTENTITKFVKVPMTYIPGSKRFDSTNNIISIAFYLNLLEHSISYNYDPQGSYNYNLYRYDVILNEYIELNIDEGDWIVDNDTGILTFHSSMNNNIPESQHINSSNPPYISFYKYSGVIGLYPLSFHNNELINIQTNLSVDENLNVLKNIIISNDGTINKNLNIGNDVVIGNNITINKNAVIDKDLYINNNLNVTNGVQLSQIEFHKLNELPEDSNSKLVYVSNNLYFNHENTWLKMGNDELILQNNEQFIYDPNSDYNILNVNTNISIVEISQTLTNDIFIILPNIQKTGIEKTIIMGQSLNNLSNNYSVVLYSNYMDVDGNGPIYMNIKFITAGQSIKLISVVSNSDGIYGNGNKYWQIVNGHFHSNDVFEYNNGDLINTNDAGSIYQPNVNNIQYESMITLNNAIPDNLLFNTHFINTSGSNILSLDSEIILLQINNNLDSNKVLTLNTDVIVGQKKMILVGDSFNTYKNGYFISIESMYMGGYNTEFVSTVSQNNIKFIKSGQYVNLILMKTMSNQFYWHVLNGEFTFV